MMKATAKVAPFDYQAKPAAAQTQSSLKPINIRGEDNFDDETLDTETVGNFSEY